MSFSEEGNYEPHSNRRSSARFENNWSGCGYVKSIRQLPINDKNTGKTYTVTDIVLIIEREVRGAIKETRVSLEAWGAMSKKCEDFQQGDILRVKGRLESKKWINQDKKEILKDVIVVEYIERAE